MAQRIQDVMTPNPVTMAATSPVTEAARAMRDQDIGNVIVEQGDSMCGIVTDRDITVRVVAEGQDPDSVKLGDICSKDVTAVSPDDSVEDAVALMRQKAVRRLPVVSGGRPVGMVSLGDLAVDAHGEDALADISAAPPNN
jgi:signal-transduction protein with cAMP-binding, CBS, and nucleotidyltransferase domain